MTRCLSFYFGRHRVPGCQGDVEGPLCIVQEAQEQVNREEGEGHQMDPDGDGIFMAHNSQTV